MAKIGSHDSMTYLPCKKWFLKPFKFMARCQSVSIQEQYDKYEVRMFDLRIKFHENEPYFAHGEMMFKGNVYDVLKWINTKENLHVRIILEENFDNHNDDDEELFMQFCENIENIYKNIRFFGGNRKYDWEVIYKFKNEDPTLDDKYSSTTGTKLDDWCPYFYAKINNKSLYANRDKCTKDYLFMDFVNIR
jgi:hypothetical protein